MTNRTKASFDSDLSCRRTQIDPVLIHNNRARLLHEGEQLDQLAGILSMAGNAVRLKILYLLFLEEKLCVCDLTDILGMKIPAVSQHLRKLKDAAMVTTRRQGQTIYYSITEEYRYYVEVFFNRMMKYKSS